MMTASWVSQKRAALSATTCSTGWISVGEAAITRRIVAGRRLLLQRFGHLAVARLHLVEQADVLDGDHRLVGECLDAARSACR